MTELDNKIHDIFPEESIYKTPTRYNMFAGVNLPSYIKDWLIKRYSDEKENVDKEALFAFLEKHIPTKDSDIKSRLMKGETIQILVRIIVESDLKSGLFKFSIPDIGIKSNEGRISDYVMRSQKGNLKEGENWGIVTLEYVQPEGREKGYADLVKFKPFKPYSPDLDYYCEARKRFNTQEWIDFIIRCMEYNPDSSQFESYTQKLLFISRLLVFCEPNLNMIELAPKGTGKSYIFNNLSKYGWMISGGKVTRAKLFYDMAAPSYPHQIIGGSLHAQLLAFRNSRRGPCIPLISPADVQLDRDEKTMVQPDVMIVCDRSKIERNRVFGAPDFIAEVLSPSTRKKDMNLKMMKYAEAGVREYWMIDPDTRQVVVYDLEHESIPVIYTFGDPIPVLVWNGECVINLTDAAELLDELNLPAD